MIVFDIEVRTREGTHCVLTISRALRRALMQINRSRIAYRDTICASFPSMVSVPLLRPMC
jgi:hypothetical protein